MIRLQVKNWDLLRHVFRLPVDFLFPLNHFHFRFLIARYQVLDFRQNLGYKCWPICPVSLKQIYGAFYFTLQGMSNSIVKYSNGVTGFLQENILGFCITKHMVDLFCLDQKNLFQEENLMLLCFENITFISSGEVELAMKTVRAHFGIFVFSKQKKYLIESFIEETQERELGKFTFKMVIKLSGLRRESRHNKTSPFWTKATCDSDIRIKKIFWQMND